jgi:hypothetical protein
MRHSDQPSQFDFGVAFGRTKGAPEADDTAFRAVQGERHDFRCPLYQWVDYWLLPTVVHDEIETADTWGDSLALADQCERAYPDARPGCG